MMKTQPSILSFFGTAKKVKVPLLWNTARTGPRPQRAPVPYTDK